MKKLLIVLLCGLFSGAQAQKFETLFEKSGGTKTPPYRDIVDFYQQLDKASGKLLLKTMGPSDAGFPLHLVLFSNDGKFDPAAWHRQKKTVILINNGIHPGEPDGIDASMLLLRDLVTGAKKIPDNVALAVIPVYNIGGCLNRSPFYRVDQNGPEEFGFRGNSQNLDLNRDFIKCDSKEARSFAEIFHTVDPDIFIDNHVSDGADYQHVMTLISSQHNKLGGAMGEYLNKEMEPALYASMKERGYDLVPYVNFFGDTPDNGWPEFFDAPRYSSGYATLWHTFGFTVETHMLKPYDQRVKSNYVLMESFCQFASKNAETIQSLRSQAIAQALGQSQFPISWELDRSQWKEIVFKGYTAGRKPSGVSGLPRLYYDRTKPYEKTVKLYNYYKPSVLVQKPVAYIIPQGWWKVIDLLKINRVAMRTLTRDTLIEVQVTRIQDYKAAPRPFEMHHLNSDVKTTSTKQKMLFRKGDYWVSLNQSANRFLMEVLEARGPDSYFAWNFFDAILQQKEGYSNYMFEDEAAAWLQSHPDVKQKLEQRRQSDSSFAKSARAQLDFVFENTPYIEPDYLRYPIYRVE
ncbi:MAG: M14 family metallopeptidase [Williamsia sp.]|nr:M14 family metallopeptidase [Williamsia sp.]